MDEQQLDRLVGDLKGLYRAYFDYHNLLRVFYSIDGNLEVVKGDTEASSQLLKEEGHESLADYVNQIPGDEQRLDKLKKEMTDLLNKRGEEIRVMRKRVSRDYQVNGQSLVSIMAHINLVSTARMCQDNYAYVYCPNNDCVSVIAKALTNGDMDEPFERAEVSGYETGNVVKFIVQKGGTQGLAGMGIISTGNSQPMLFEALIRVFRDPQYRSNLTAD